MEQYFEAVVINPIAVNGDLREFIVPFAAGTLTRIDFETDNANGAGAAIFDVLLNGTTIFPGGVGRPEIAAAALSGNASGLDLAVVRGDNIKITAASVPSGGIGGKLYIVANLEDGVATGGGELAGDVTGDGGANTVEKIRGRVVDAMTVTPEDVDFDEFITWINQYQLGDSGGAGGTGANGFIRSNQSNWWLASADCNRVSNPGEAVEFWFTPLSGTAGGNYGLGAQAVDYNAQGADINLRWHIRGNDSGTAAVFENAGAGAAIKSAYFAITVATVFKIRVEEDGSVKYYLDDVLKYTSAIDPATVQGWALRAQVSLGYYGGNAPEAPNANGYQGCTESHIKILSEAFDPVPDGAGLRWHEGMQKIIADISLGGIPFVGVILPGQVWMLSDDGTEYVPRTISQAVVGGEAEQDIAWTALTMSAAVDGANRLYTVSDWDAVTRQGANATQTINNVGGYVSFKVGGAGESTRYVGLRNTASDHNAVNFDPYRIQFRADGTYRIVEADVEVLIGTAYADNDVFVMECYNDAGTPKLKVLQNTVLKHTFANSPTFPLRFDVEMPFGGGTLRNGKIRRTFE